MKLKIKKRDGRVVPYDVKKIEISIKKAMESVGIENGEDIVFLVEEKIKEINKYPISIEDVQDIIEECLMDLGYNSVAKAYILYREKHKRQRQLKDTLEIVDDLKLGLNAAKLLKDRYLKRDIEGKIVETPSELFRRVAKHVAKADLNYDKKADVETVEELFYRAMVNMEFLPNSPTLFSAGRNNNTLAACFCLDIEDTLEDIFEKVKQTGIITKMGGGVGLAFSNLRPKNSPVGSTGGISSGPVSFMRVFDTAIDVCRQGGVRRGALMGVLSCHHPDILEFIQCKQDKKSFKNFNISVLVTDKFMTAYYDDCDYDLINPHTGKVVRQLPARLVMDYIVLCAHNSGDPGMVFIDRINKKHPLRNLEIKGVNVCGEMPLAPNESCLLGAINLSKFVKDKKVDYKELRRIVTLVVHFLDNLIDVNIYPLKQIDEATRKSRKIGVGIMGWAEMLIQLGVSYDSLEAIELAETVMGFIDNEAHKASRDLAVIRGNFPLFDDYKRNYRNMRNATVTTAAPTGSRSLLASTSSGIEPLFSVAQTRVTGDGLVLSDFNKYFINTLKERGLWNEELKLLVGEKGHIGDIDEIPDDIKELYKTSHEIPPLQHVLMQAAFQKHIGSSVSKCVSIDTMILTDTGIKSIGDIMSEVKKNTNVDVYADIELQVAGEKKPEKATKVYHNGIKETKRVTLKNGLIMEGTMQHRVKGFKDGIYDWLSLDELTVGEHVAYKVGSNIFNTKKLLFDFSYTKHGNQKDIVVPEEMDEGLATLLGCYISEGSITNSSWRVQITNNNVDVLNYCSEQFKRVFGLESKFVIDKRNGVKSIEINSKTLSEFFNYIGAGGKAPEKDIPWSILQSNRKCQFAFIKGLWLDGYARKNGLAITVASESMMKKLQIMLLNLGIKSNRRNKWNKEYERYYFELQLGREESNRFLREIKLFDEWKNKSWDKKSVNTTDIIPIKAHEVAKLCKNAVSISKGKLEYMYRIRIRGEQKYKHFITFEKVTDVVYNPEIYGIDVNSEIFLLMRFLIENNIHFSEVISIEDTSSDTYDLVVPKSKHYLANGIISHNTVNLSNNATLEDVRAVYLKAYETSCKGITIFRDGCLGQQVLYAGCETCDI